MASTKQAQRFWLATASRAWIGLFLGWLAGLVGCGAPAADSPQTSSPAAENTSSPSTDSPGVAGQVGASAACRAIAEAIRAARQRSDLPLLVTSDLLQAEAQGDADAVVAALRRDPGQPIKLDASAGRRLKSAWPSLAQLNLQLFRGDSPERLAERAAAGTAARRSELTHLGVGLAEASDAARRSWLAVVIVGRTLPAISPELLNEGKREFDLKCFLCQYEDLIRLHPSASGSPATLLAICPKCQAVIDVYGLDRQQRYHRATWFLRHFQPHAVRSPVEAWSRVLQYRRPSDVRRRQVGDVWQTAQETYQSRQGDAKDVAILLADWLGAGGYDARLVIGLVEGNSRVWVVLRAEDRDYILETAGERAGHVRMPPRAESMTTYVPRVQFNRTGIWFRTSSAWTGDYQNTQLWSRGPWPVEAFQDETSTQPR
jgi:hypothetical protein